MTTNKKKNILVSTATVFLFMALINGLPYGFFTILRFVVFAITLRIAWMSYEQQKERWVWIFGFIAVLFNPLFPIYLNRSLWSVIDLVTGLFLIVSIFILKFTHKP